MPGGEVDAAAVLDACRARGWRLATAESCTGGLIAAGLTDIAGASDVVEGGVVVYADAQKIRWLRVRPEVLARDGAVSEATARAMAEGCRETFGVDVAVAVTGIAGPSGGSAEKPVGLVHIAVASSGVTTHRRAVFDGDRRGIREATVDTAFAMVASAAGGSEVA